MIKQILDQIKQTLREHGVDYQKLIDDFGQVDACESRSRGKSFGLGEHVKGLIYAQLSNQRPWKQIAKHRTEIDKIFSYYNAEVLKQEDPEKLTAKIQEIKCGNIKISQQMDNLRVNIELLEKISLEYGSVDSFVESKEPEKIAKELGSGKKYKLKEIGFTLAMEYLKNVGIEVIKPDRHICRIIGPERLGLIEREPSPEDVYLCLVQLEKKTNHSAVFIDNLLWIFAAQDYGNICSKNPKCSECRVKLCAMHPSKSERDTTV